MILLHKLGEPIYKCAVDPFTEEILYGKKIGIGFEERRITIDSINNLKFTEIANKDLIINKY